MTRRIFSPEFKRETAQLVTARGVSVAQAAKDLDVHITVLRRWVRELGSNGSNAFPGKGQLKPDDEELRNLRREVAKLKAERDILKKAIAYFARGVCQRSRPPISCGVSDFMGAGFVFRVEPDRSRRLPVAGFA